MTTVGPMLVTVSIHLMDRMLTYILELTGGQTYTAIVQLS